MEKLQYLLKDIANNMDGHTFADSELRYVSTLLKPHKFYKHPSMIVTQRISQRDKAWRKICKAQRQLRYIEWKGVKIYDFQKVTFSTLFKLHIAGLGVLIPKRYHMLG